MNWIRIEDLSRFLNEFKPELIPPEDPAHTEFWRDRKRKCIEGIWFEDFGKYRYGPGNLGFYHWYTRIMDVNREANTFGTKIKPLIRDLEWHRMYYVLEARGFSGFRDDDKYTSEHSILDISKNRISINDPRYLRLFKSNGTFKEYIDPRENLFRLHDHPVGTPLYRNPARNYVELGSRGGGKSVFFILAIIKHELCFDGLRYYTDEGRTDPPAALVSIGSGMAAKSSETLQKLEASMLNLEIDPECGTWGIKGKDEDYEPCPFFKRMSGDLDPNNSDNPWTNKFEVKFNNEWRKFGTGSSLYHNVYSRNKKAGAQAAAGGRRNVVFYEEIGLMDQFTEAWGSDDAVVIIDGWQFGIKIGIGTSGNMDTIIGAQKVFTHPKAYNCLEFDTDQGKTCFFLPAYMVNKDYKDENGNTDIEGAKSFYDEKLRIAMETGDPQIINSHKMNFPTEIDHMWVNKLGQLLPKKEAENRIKELLKDNLYEKLGTPVELFYDSNQTYGVNYEVKHVADPYYDLNISDKQDKSGEIMIYDPPFYLNGSIPEDMYIFVHDPYVSDNWDEGGSVGVTYVFVNPKYIPYGAKGNCMAASYIGKHSKGLKGYNENVFKLWQLYGRPRRKLWYEGIRGDSIRDFFIYKNSAYALCLRPQFSKGRNLFVQNTNKTGFDVGNEVSKIGMIDRLHDYLIDETTLGGEVKKNIERIPCIFALRQIAAYDLKGNYDAVSALLALPLALDEIKFIEEEGIANKNNNTLQPITRGFSKFLRRHGAIRTNL